MDKGDQRAERDARTDRRGLRQVYRGAWEALESSNAPVPASAALVVACIIAPEFANVVQDHQVSWTLYLTLSELSKAVLCLMIPLRTWSYLGALWFTTQAIDEATNGNLFNEQQWEYIILIALVALTWSIQRKE